MTPNETLTRRRDPHHKDCWLICFGDVHVGKIARAVGNPGLPSDGRGTAASTPAAIPASSATAPH
jgi:hypothetical protein